MNKKKLSDIAIITMGQSPESSFYNTAGLGMPFLQGSKTFGKIYPTFPSFTEKITKIALKGDILMSVRAPVGDINIAPVDMCIGRGLCSIRMKNGNQKYLYYLLKNNIHNILSKQNGTVFASINRKDLEDLEFSILEEREQKSSGDFLALFDEKIKVNDEINDNLSKQCSMLFEQMFPDIFDFAESDFIELSSIASIFSGKRPLTRSDALTEECWIPIVGAASVMGFTNESLFNEPLIITGRVGTHGVIQRFNSNCWPSDNTLVIKTPYYEYVYQVLSRINFSNLNRGSTQPLITKSDLAKIKLKRVSMELIKRFDRIAGALMSLFDLNISSNRKLAECRDALMPKLLRGEIEISPVIGE